MSKTLITLIFSLVVASAIGQKLWQKQGFKPPPSVCYASDKTEKVFIPPPAGVLNLLKSAEKKSDIIVNYSLFPTEAIKAFEHAVSIWEGLIESPVPIYIQANWRPQGQNILGSCAPADFVKDFEGAPRKNIYYPVALAEKITATELTGPDQPDMVADFNEDIIWYFGIDGKTPRLRYDFVTVVLHEIGHGLGFTGFFYVENQSGEYSWLDLGDASSFDRLVENLNGDQLINTSVFANPSALLKDALVSNMLYANSPVVLADDENRPRLFAPSEWDNGSSIYHLNDATYPSGTINSLMTHSMGKGEAIHDPGPLTMGIMADMGWKSMYIDFAPPKDKELLETIPFEVRITSDYLLDTAQLFVVLSTDSFATPPDSLPLLVNEAGLFEVQWIPPTGTETVQYYISAEDEKSRVFNKPSEAPLEFFTLNFGPDTEKPVIWHEPITYFFDTGNNLRISVQADDNLGVDTVYVEYSVNGAEQLTFGLAHDSATTYSAIFPFENNLLNDGDEITYNVVARDASVAQNTRILPVESKFSFKVEKMYAPIAGYINNFDNTTADFILTDFDVFTADGFENGALHSPHPYPSPEEDNEEFNFSTILKYPIILNENASMTFDEIVLVEPGDEDTFFGDFGFWDYVIAEGSKDKGETWLPLTDGYDSREYTTWESSYNDSISGINSTTKGSPEWFINREIDMLENGNFSVGDTVIIRFRLYSDPYAHGWGWAIDNLRVQSPVSVSQPVLSPGNILVYPNPFSKSFRVLTEPEKPVEELQFDVFNMYGQKIQSVLLHYVDAPVTTEIEIGNGMSGIYFLVVKENGRQVFTKKIIHN